MKPAHTFSFFRTTSDIFASSQRKASATFCSTVISLYLSSHSLREASSLHLIGRAQSRDIAQCRETTRTFVPFYNPAKCRQLHHSENEFQRKTSLMKINRHQKDSAESSRISQVRESARSQRTSQTHRIGSTPGIRQIPAHGFSRTSHRPPQPATARGSQPGRGLIVKRLLGLIRVRGVPIVRAQGPFLYLL